MFFFSPWQIAEHATSLAFLQIVAGFLIIIALTSTTVFLLKSKHFSLQILDKAIAVPLATLIIFTIFYSLISGAERQLSTRLPLYSGPLNYIIWEPFQWKASKYENHAGDNINFRQLTQVSLEEYANSIDSTKLEQHNVLLIVIESLRPDVFTTLGGKRSVMPFLEEYSKRGLIFSNAHSQSSHSNYADVSILSSQYPLRATHPYYYPENIPFPRAMLQDILKPLGYKSAIFSSQKEHWGGMLNYIDTGNFDNIIHAGNYDGAQRVEHGIYGKMDQQWRSYKETFDRLGHSGKLDDKTTIDLAIEWLSNLNGANFYTYINLQSSHAPYYVPKHFTRKFFSGDKEALEHLEQGNILQLTIEEMESAYWDSLYYIDHQLKRLVTHLDKQKLLDNTLVVVTGDTATSFHTSIVDDYSTKLILGNGGELFEEVIHVPLFIAGPGIEKGYRNYLVQHIDIMPAILHALRLPTHPAFQGRNALDPPIDRQSEFAFHVAQTPAANQIAVTHNDWRLVLDKMSGELLVYYLKDTQPNSDDFELVKKEMYNRLLMWEKLQLEYYSNPASMNTFYPPVLMNSTFDVY
jgi:arylsulfatase A-like enzyme